MQKEQLQDQQTYNNYSNINITSEPLQENQIHYNQKILFNKNDISFQRHFQNNVIDTEHVNDLDNSVVQTDQKVFQLNKNKQIQENRKQAKTEIHINDVDVSDEFNTPKKQKTLEKHQFDHIQNQMGKTIQKRRNTKALTQKELQKIQDKRFSYQSEIEKIIEKGKLKLESQRLIADSQKQINSEINKKPLNPLQTMLTKQITMQTKQDQPLNILFISKIRQFVRNYRARQPVLTKNVKRVVNDQADSLNEIIPKNMNIFVRKIQKQLKQFQNIFIKFLESKCMQCIPVIKPGNPVLFVWDIYQLILIIMVIFMLSIDLVFQLGNQKLYYENILSFRLLLSVSFFLHILINCNTQCIQQGQLVKDRKIIIKKYFKNYFWFDFIPMVPIILSFDQDFRQNKIDNAYKIILKSMLFFKIISFLEIKKRVENVISFKQKRKPYLNLLNLFMSLMLFAHISSLINFGITIIEIEIYNQENTWYETLQIMNKNWIEQYIYIFYWSASLMMSVVVYYPETQTEIILFTFLLISSCGIFAYSINVLGNIIEEIQKPKNTFVKELDLLKSYMNKKNISQDLKLRILDYLNYIYQIKQFKTTEEENFLVQNLLSEQLQQSIKEETKGTLLNSIPFFAKNFSPQTIQQLMNYVEEVQYGDNDIVFTQDDCYEDSSVYILERGKLELFLYQEIEEQSINSVKTNYTPIKIAQKSQNKQLDIFGMYEFITGLPNNCSARSVEYCTLFQIKRKHFIQILKDQIISNHNNKDFETFYKIKETLCNVEPENFSKVQELYNMKIQCYLCNNRLHNLESCNHIRYIPFKKKLQEKYIYKFTRQFQERRKYFPRPIKIKQSILQNNNNSEKCDYPTFKYKNNNNKKSLNENNMNINCLQSSSIQQNIELTPIEYMYQYESKFQGFDKNGQRKKYKIYHSLQKQNLIQNKLVVQRIKQDFEENEDYQDIIELIEQEQDYIDEYKDKEDYSFENKSFVTASDISQSDINNLTNNFKKEPVKHSYGDLKRATFQKNTQLSIIDIVQHNILMSNNNTKNQPGETSFNQNSKDQDQELNDLQHLKHLQQESRKKGESLKDISSPVKIEINKISPLKQRSSSVASIPSPKNKEKEKKTYDEKFLANEKRKKRLKSLRSVRLFNPIVKKAVTERQRINSKRISTQMETKQTSNDLNSPQQLQSNFFNPETFIYTFQEIIKDQFKQYLMHPMVSSSVNTNTQNSLNQPKRKLSIINNNLQLPLSNIMNNSLNSNKTSNTFIKQIPKQNQSPSNFKTSLSKQQNQIQAFQQFQQENEENTNELNSTPDTQRMKFFKMGAYLKAPQSKIQTVDMLMQVQITLLQYELKNSKFIQDLTQNKEIFEIIQVDNLFGENKCEQLSEYEFFDPQWNISIILNKINNLEDKYNIKINKKNQLAKNGKKKGAFNRKSNLSFGIQQFQSNQFKQQQQQQQINNDSDHKLNSNVLKTNKSSLPRKISIIQQNTVQSSNKKSNNDNN